MYLFQTLSSFFPILFCVFLIIYAKISISLMHGSNLLTTVHDLQTCNELFPPLRGDQKVSPPLSLAIYFQVNRQEERKISNRIHYLMLQLFSKLNFYKIYDSLENWYEDLRSESIKDFECTITIHCNFRCL